MRVITGPARLVLLVAVALTGIVGCSASTAETTATPGIEDLPDEVVDALDDFDIDLEPAPETDLAELDPCDLLTPDEAEIYVKAEVEVVTPDFMSEPPNWQCLWLDEGSDGFDVLLMYYDNWDLSAFDDADLGIRVETFDGLDVEAALLQPNEVSMERDGTSADQVFYLWTRKNGYTLQFGGRTWDDSLQLGTQEFDDFIEVVEIALSRVP